MSESGSVAVSAEALLRQPVDDGRIGARAAPKSEHHDTLLPSMADYPGRGESAQAI